MSSFEFNFDEDALRQLAREVGEKVAATYQVALDEVFVAHAGQPVDSVKLALASAWERVNGGAITDPELTTWAQEIANGNRVIFEVGEPEI